jgi:hypothetical protein
LDPRQNLAFYDRENLCRFFYRPEFNEFIPPLANCDISTCAGILTFPAIEYRSKRNTAAPGRVLIPLADPIPLETRIDLTALDRKFELILGIPPSPATSSLPVLMVLQRQSDPRTFRFQCQIVEIDGTRTMFR